MNGRTDIARVAGAHAVQLGRGSLPIDAARRVLAAAAEYSAVDGSIVHNVDADAAIRVIADAEGTPAKLMRDPRAVAEMRQAIQEQEAERAQMEQLMAMAEGAGKAAPAIQAAQAA